MKLNRTLIMAGLITGSMLSATVAAHAQATTNTPPAAAHRPGARNNMAIDALATRLALTDEQKEKVRTVIQERNRKIAELRKDTTLSRAERQAKVKALREDTTAKFKEILTPEQFEKYQAMTTPRHHPPTAPPATPATPAAPPAGNGGSQQ